MQLWAYTYYLSRNSTTSNSIQQHEKQHTTGATSGQEPPTCISILLHNKEFSAFRTHLPILPPSKECTGSIVKGKFDYERCQTQ